MIADSSYSVLNRVDFYVEEALKNKGKGRNFGVDVTLERYLNDGVYYMISGSLFSSKYKGGDGKWRNTKYNRQFIINCLGGKEWMLGQDKIVIVRLTGWQRLTIPIKWYNMMKRKHSRNNSRRCLSSITRSVTR